MHASAKKAICMSPQASSQRPYAEFLSALARLAALVRQCSLQVSRWSIKMAKGSLFAMRPVLREPKPTKAPSWSTVEDTPRKPGFTGVRRFVDIQQYELAVRTQ